LKSTLHGLVALGLALQGASAAVHAESASNVQILSAIVRDQKIDGASVILQKNGEQSFVATTDSQGHASVPDSVAADPAALVIVRKEGYSDLVAKCPCAGMTYAVSPFMDKLDGMRIVLNWGARPSDLDGHLAFPRNHVFFLGKLGGDAQLDVDHVDGYGPETITIMRKHPGERYVYAVHDFADRGQPETSDLSASEAKVFVYVGQTLIRTYYVPKGRKGNIWTVFAISAEGELQDINTMSGASAFSSTDVTTELVFGGQYANRGQAASSTGPAAAGTAVTFIPAAIPESAHKLNVQGEAAYRGGDYPKAVQLFQAAIAIDDNYGQAYSNLGLVFQKSSHVAEALWANRKAIALATGPNAATTRAGTHFNNGRIYEDKEQWSDALREYRAAQAEKSNSIYQNAIARAEQHGAR
jgi:TPR repeat